MVTPTLEIACFSPQALLQAANTPAQRLEYCAHYDLGGITPPLHGFDALRQQVPQPIFVMIRPRGGDFVYSNTEVKHMQQQIRDFQAAGADGFVFGTLLPHDRLDQFALEKLAQAVGTQPWTFHRAFDQLQEPDTALPTLAEAGCRNILSAGSAPSARQGLTRLLHYSQIAPPGLRILAGGGIRASNLPELLQNTAPLDFHSAALLPGTELLNTREVTEMHQQIVDFYT